MPEVVAQPADKAVERAKELGVPKIYFNGFSSGLTNGDVYVVGQFHNEPNAVLSMSYTVAKTLAVSLSQIIAAIEERAGREIMTTKDIERIFSESEEKQ